MRQGKAIGIKQQKERQRQQPQSPSLLRTWKAMLVRHATWGVWGVTYNTYRAIPRQSLARLSDGDGDYGLLLLLPFSRNPLLRCSPFAADEETGGGTCRAHWEISGAPLQLAPRACVSDLSFFLDSGDAKSCSNSVARDSIEKGGPFVGWSFGVCRSTTGDVSLRVAPRPICLFDSYETVMPSRRRLRGVWTRCGY